MYCSSCGLEVPHELNYCNRCGANLNPPNNFIPQMPSPPVKLTGPSIALSLMVVFSIAAIFSGVNGLALKGIHPVALAWIVIISMGMVFGVAAFFIRLLTKLLANSSSSIEHRRAQSKKPQPNAQLNPAQTGPMNAPISSVTDHTTRTFEPSYREKAERGK